MKKTIKTVRGDNIIIEQPSKDLAPDLMVEYRHPSLDRQPIQLADDNVVALIKALCATLPNDVMYELADAIKRDVFLAERKEFLRNKE